jgi:hypothetical protein
VPDFPAEKVEDAKRAVRRHLRIRRGRVIERAMQAIPLIAPLSIRELPLEEKSK